MNNFEVGVERARRKQQHRKFIGRIHAETLKTWAKIATRKEKDKFVKMFKKYIRI